MKLNLINSEGLTLKAINKEYSTRKGLTLFQEVQTSKRCQSQKSILKDVSECIFP